MQKSYRSILPASDPRSNTHNVPESSTSHKRKRSSVACTRCRVKKIGCDGGLPACLSCGERGLLCEYPEMNNLPFARLKRENIALKEQNKELAEIIESFKNGSEQVAIENLKKFRLLGKSYATLPPPEITTVSNSTLLAQIWPTPPAQDGIEFELMIRHPIAYPALMDLGIPRVDSASSHPPCLTPRQHHSLLERGAASLAETFFNEAKALWEQNRTLDTLPTVAAAQLLSLIRIYNGNDGGLPYIVEGIEMAKRMNLFQDIGHYTFNQESKKEADEITLHLTVTYRSAYQRSGYTAFWHVALLYVGNAVLQDSSDPQWRQYLDLCVGGYADLYCGFRVAGDIAKSLLALAVCRGLMTLAEAKALLSNVHANGTHHTLVERVNTTFVVDLSAAVSHRGDSVLERLADTFDGLAVFEEFTSAADFVVT
ncbi:hypothetical protein PG989_016436 [Apiospora arundinis]